jgi:uncharacterized RDD family membrane protein YckC
VAIDPAERVVQMRCPQCREFRRVAPPAPGHVQYCHACGAILVDPAVRRRYAGFWRRFAGWAIDLAIVLAATVGLIWAALASGVRIHDDELAFWSVLLAYQCISVAYYWPLVAAGATAGKFIMGLRVVDADGRRPGFVRSIKRYGIAYVSNSMLRLGYLWMISDDNKQTWHDWAAGTYVVKR